MSGITKEVRGSAIQRVDDGKNLKFQDQTPFDGKPGNLEPMLREAEIRFNVQDAIYNSPTKKAYYVLSLFKTGNAKLWKEQYIRQREGKTLCEGDLWTEFTRTLKEDFKAVGSQHDAIYRLYNTKQPASPVNESTIKIRLNIHIPVF